MSNNLEITYVSASQNQKEVTINAMLDELVAAISNSISIATADANVTLSTGEAPPTGTGQALGNMVFVFTGADTAARNVIVPTNKKLYIVKNSTTGGFKLTIKTSGGTGVDFLSTDGYMLVYCDGTNVVPIAGGGGGGIAIGGVLKKTADYTIVSGDIGKLIVLTTGTHTFTPPAVNASFFCFIANIGTGVLTLSRNGVNLDGATADLAIAQFEGVLFFSDGTDNFTVRGIGGSGGSSTLGGLTDVSLSSPADGDLLTYETSSTLWKNKPAGGAGGAKAFQNIQRRAMITADGNGTTLSLVGESVAIVSGSATAKVATSTKGAAVEYTPGGSSQFYMIGNQTNYKMGRHLKLLLDFYLTTTGDNFSWIMLTDPPGNNLTQGRTNTPGASAGANYAGFRCNNRSGSGTETTWFACCGDAAADTAVDTTVTQDAVGHRFAMIFDDDNSQILYYIDGTLVATLTTHRPTAGTLLELYISEYFASTPPATGISQVIIDSDL